MTMATHGATARSSHEEEGERGETIGSRSDQAPPGADRVVRFHPTADRISSPVQEILDTLADVSGGDAGFCRELVSVYLAEGARMTRELRHAVDARDPLALREVAHAFKGCSAAMGAREMTNACGVAEALMRAGAAVEQADPCVARTEAEWERVEHALESWLALA